MTAVEFNKNLISLEDSMKKFALSLTNDQTRAEDLKQDTYMKAFNYRDKFVDCINLKAWVFTIMKNTFINNYRRSVKENTIIDNSKDLYLLNLPQKSGSVSPESKYSVDELEKIIDSLEDEFRIPFRMHVQGFKYREIAEKLDLKIGTVKSRIFFTRKKLMVTLSNYI